MKKLIYILGLLLCFSSCEDDRTVVSAPDEDSAIKVGESVQFASSMHKTPSTRADVLNTELLGKYTSIAADYSLTVSMLEKGNNTGDPASCEYKPVKNALQVYDNEGTLEPTGSTPLLWQSNVKKYAFKAVAGSDILDPDQSTEEKLLWQDRIEGYAFSPFTPDGGTPDVEGVANYHTSKEWYQLNKGWHDTQGQMLGSNDYKKIPLFLQHKRAKITLKLRAGIGVSRESLKSIHAENVKTQIHSYTLDSDNNPVAKAINKPLVGEWNCEYAEDVNGGDETLSNVLFDAIVEPYDYTQNPTKDKIASISVSGLNFSFFAANDNNWSSEEQRQKYNLTAGKHLTIEATLSSERIVFITAWIEDWTEVITNTICDDYGQNGDPTVIKSRSDLIEFLSSTELNKAGNVAIIAANSLDLDTDAETTGSASDPWTNHSNYELHGTLNLAGASLKTSGRLFKSMSSTANLINGTVIMNNAAAVTSAVAEINDGTIERVDVTVGNPLAKASTAGLVTINRGTIHQCVSSLPIEGVTSSISVGDNTINNIYVGGIAAQSIARNQNTTPVIDACTVTARVKSDVAEVYGGGIVGLAEGRLTNNTFEYGITLLQNKVRFKNIVADQHGTGTDILYVDKNAWPTKAENEIAGTNANDAKYDNVLDSQEELEALLDAQYNISGKKYRISDSFTVLSETWDHALTNEDLTSAQGACNGNLYCELDGNGKTISLDSKNATEDNTVKLPTAYNTDASVNTEDTGTQTTHMLFSNITGSLHDLTISLNKPLIATPGLSSENKPNATDAIAPLAYSVSGPMASIKNVKVKMAEGAYVQSATPAGLVCWAYNGATVENCEVKGIVKTWVPDNGNHGEDVSDARRYAGGVLACAANATIKGCVYHTDKNTLLAVTKDEQSGAGIIQIYYGGILGGTAVKTIGHTREVPTVSVIDCVSWYDNSTIDSFHGSVIGYAVYTENNVLTNGTVTTGDRTCQGNWWKNQGIGTIINGMTIDEVIGKCNAVTPTQDDNF